jgi:hypothetical protein
VTLHPEVFNAILDVCDARDLARMCGANDDQVSGLIDQINKEILEPALLAHGLMKPPRKWGRPVGSGKPRRDWSKATPRLPEKEWLMMRARIFQRDGYVCRYCSAENVKFAIDHVVPLSRGGTNDEDNLVVACFACNSSKNDKLLSEWRGRFVWQ